MCSRIRLINSRRGIPTWYPIPFVMLILGMSDYTIFVKDQAQVFLGGPPLVKMATGEIVDSETLGGAAMHSSKSGLSDFLAPDEFSGILAARRWVRSINPSRMGSPNQTVIAPKYDVEDLLGIVGTDIRKGVMPMGEIIARIVDASRFEIFKPLYGKNMLCCWAYIHGTRFAQRDTNGRSFNWNNRKRTTSNIRP
jgi:acyl-CoA carboxylase subunit beta